MMSLIMQRSITIQAGKIRRAEMSSYYLSTEEVQQSPDLPYEINNIMDAVSEDCFVRVKGFYEKDFEDKQRVRIHEVEWILTADLHQDNIDDGWFDPKQFIKDCWMFLDYQELAKQDDSYRQLLDDLDLL